MLRMLAACAGMYARHAWRIMQDGWYMHAFHRRTILARTSETVCKISQMVSPEDRDLEDLTAGRSQVPCPHRR